MVFNPFARLKSPITRAFIHIFNRVFNGFAKNAVEFPLYKQYLCLVARVPN